MLTPEKIRNVAVLGHQGCGKTTLVESLAYKANALHKKGSIETKDTISDYLPVEKKRQSSVSSSFVPLAYHDYKINLIDVPGSDDFIFETLGITRLIKGAVLVIDAAKGVQIGTVKAFHQLKKRGVPIFIYISKMDKEYVNFEDLYHEIQQKLDPKKCVPFSYPIGRVDRFDGFVNLVELKARKYNGRECVDDVIYEDKRQIVFELHNRLCEAVATTSDELLDKFFSGEPLTNEEIKTGLRQGVLNGELYPILVGSAVKDIGSLTLLQMLVDYLPSPSDLKPYVAKDLEGKDVEVKTVNDEPLSLMIFKNAFDPYKGLISTFKVNSGVLHLGDEIYCPDTEKTYRVTNLYTQFGEKLEPVKEVTAGDIGAFTKIDMLPLSTTLCSPDRKLIFHKTHYPTPTYFRAIVPETKNDSDKLFPVVSKLTYEDPSITIERREESGEFLLGDSSSTHMEFVLDELRDDYKLKFHTAVPSIVYKETITKKGEAEGRYIKQSGGSGFYGVVNMSFEPSEKNEFESQIYGGHIDKGYIPAVEKGFYEALKHGGLIGGEVLRVKAILKDGKQHPVDSNELAFKNAAILAFRQAYDECAPVILEPIDKIVVNCAPEYLGNVLSDLSKKRGRILGTEEEEDGGSLNVVALVPEAEILEYTNELKSITKSTGFFNREFDSYQPVSKELEAKIIAAQKK